MSKPYGLNLIDFVAIFVFGFTFLIMVFDKSLAIGYLLFIMLASFFSIFNNYIDSREAKK